MKPEPATKTEALPLEPLHVQKVPFEALLERYRAETKSTTYRTDYRERRGDFMLLPALLIASTSESLRQDPARRDTPNSGFVTPGVIAAHLTLLGFLPAGTDLLIEF